MPLIGTLFSTSPQGSNVGKKYVPPTYLGDNP